MPVPGQPAGLGAWGGWCWYEEDRVIVDGDQVLIGTVASPSGDIQVTSWDLRTGEVITAVLHERLQSDDHASPALLRLPDGRYLVSYATHIDNAPDHPDDDRMRWRRSGAAGDIRTWEPEQALSVRAAVSYTNLLQLSAEDGRIYNFHRGFGFDPNWLVSDDAGATFRYGGRLLSWDADRQSSGSGRPYVRYASDGVATIHVVSTEDHPRHHDNSIWHGMIRGGQLLDSAGRALGPLSRSQKTTFSPRDLTQVFQGTPDDVAWTSDVALDPQGRPVISFSLQHGDGDKKHERRAGGDDLRYVWARWDGAAWEVDRIGYAGTKLYSPEVDYAGLVALDRRDPTVVYASTNADPATGAPLISAADGERHWEIYRGQKQAHGQPWRWTALTRDSTADNLRPVARDAGARGSIIIWLRGDYRTYTDYTLEVVGLLDAAPAR